jgi:hypothetical protein
MAGVSHLLVLAVLFSFSTSSEALPVPFDDNSYKLPSIYAPSGNGKSSRALNTARGPIASNWGQWKETSMPNSARFSSDRSGTLSSFNPGTQSNYDSDEEGSLPSEASFQNYYKPDDKEIEAYQDHYNMQRATQSHIARQPYHQYPEYTYASHDNYSQHAFHGAQFDGQGGVPSTAYQGDMSPELSSHSYWVTPVQRTGNNPYDAHYTHGQMAQRGGNTYGEAQYGGSHRQDAGRNTSKSSSRGSGVFTPLNGGYATKEELKGQLEQRRAKRQTSRERHLEMIESVQAKLEDINAQLRDPSLSEKRRMHLEQMKKNGEGVLKESARRDKTARLNGDESFGSESIYQPGHEQGKGKGKATGVSSRAGEGRIGNLVDAIAKLRHN